MLCIRESHPIGYQLAQGSVLGPLLFVLYANDLQLHLSSSIVQYADDIFIFRNVYSHSCDPDLQNDLMTIADWAKSNSLRLNPDKCKTVRLSWRHLPKPCYQLNGAPLECVDSLKLLGCSIQSNLSWDLQVKETVSKCNRMIGLIRMIVGNCNPEVALHLYKSLVLPTLEYCSPVWWVHKRKHIDILEGIQRRASRMILRQRYMEQSYLDRVKPSIPMHLLCPGRTAPYIFDAKSFC